MELKYHVWFDSPRETIKIAVEASSIKEANQKAFLRLADKHNAKQFRLVQTIEQTNNTSPWIKLQEAKV